MGIRTVIEDDENVLDDSESDQIEDTADTAVGSELPEDPEGEEIAAASDEFSVSIGEEEPEEAPHGPAPAWVKEMRKQNRELKKKLRQLEQIAPVQPQAPEITLGEKPTLEAADYDTKKYEADLATWYAKKLALDEQSNRAKQQAEEQKRQWAERTSAYERAKGALAAEDFDDAEMVVRDALDVTQQGIIVHGAKDAALLVYALGKNPAKAAALGAIKDPVQFAFAVARLEAQLKVTGKKPATPPETRVVGNGRTSGGSDATLERLRAEAERTGDYTKVAAYKRQKQNARR